MSGSRGLPLLLAFCALAVAALGVGPLIYGSLVPGAEWSGGCLILVVPVLLFLLLVGSAVWLWRLRRNEPRRPEIDRRLWQAALGQSRPPAADRPPAGVSPPRPGGPKDQS